MQGQPRPVAGAKPDRPKPPFALTESGTHGLRVAATNQAADALGVTPGLSFSDARARAPHLLSEPIDRQADAEALHMLGLWLIRLAPLVALDGQDGLMLETTGCAHLYGGEEGLLAELSRLLTRDGIPHQAAIAGTQAAAAALARTRAGTALPIRGEADGLKDLSITALRLSIEAETLLRRFGLTQIGQLYEIDRKALTRRFPSKSQAEAVMLRLDQALGRRPEPIRPLQPVAAREVRLPCPEPIASSEAVQHGLQTLAEQLCAELAEHGLGARGFVLRAFRADGSQDAVRIEAARPVRDAKHVLRLFAERIDRLDPGFGIDLLLLEAHRTGPMSVSAIALSGDLAASDSDPVVLAALADRIQAKLGPGYVTVEVPQDRHLPELATAREPFTGDLPPAPDPVKGPRPLRLFETPEHVAVLAEVPDGPPQRFVWRRIARHIVKADGPERISPEWWQHQAPPPRAPSPDVVERPWLSPKLDRRADAQQIAKIRAELEAEDVGTPISNLPRARDYYRVEDAEGRRYWLYRDGLYEDGRGGSPNWYIHGLFS